MKSFIHKSGTQRKACKIKFYRRGGGWTKRRRGAGPTREVAAAALEAVRAPNQETIPGWKYAARVVEGRGRGY